MKKLSIKMAILIFTVYVAISYSCISYMEYTKHTGIYKSYTVSSSTLSKLQTTKLVFTTGGILLVGVLIYFTDWRGSKKDK